MRVAIASKTALLLLPFVPLIVTAARRAESFPQASGRFTDPQFVAEGAKLFGTNCGNAYCHGTGGMGGGAPRLRDKGLEASYAFKAISNGIPGTSMPSFKSELSEEQIWKLVSFIVSDANTSGIRSPAAATPTPGSSSTAPVNAAEEIASAPLPGNAQAGKKLFFDSSQPKSCHACHSFNGEGTPIGPDLSAAATRSPRELFLSIILSREIKDLRYATITVALRSGDKIIGVKKEEDAESLRVYDTAELPAVLRTIQKENVSKVEYANESVMPKDYASSYTMKQLLDLVAFLKSQSKPAVTLKDLFQ